MCQIMLSDLLLDGTLTRIEFSEKENPCVLAVSATDVEEKTDSNHIVADLKKMLIGISHTCLK